MSDLISRQALKDAMYHKAFETDSDMQKWDSGCWIRYKLFENTIDEMPIAERTGHWADGHQYGFSGTYWYRYCSLCGYVRSDDDEEKDTNYCPNCGARMKGEEDVSESN